MRAYPLFVFLMCLTPALWAQEACNVAFANRPVTEEKLRDQNEFLMAAATGTSVTGKYVWRVEGREAFISPPQQYRSQLSSMINNQDEILLKHLSQRENRKEYPIEKIRSDVTDKLSIAEYNLNQRYSNDRRKGTASNSVRINEYNGLVAYGIRVRYIQDGKPVPNASFLHGLVYEKGNVTASQATGLTVEAIPYAGVIQSVVINPGKNYATLIVTLQTPTGEIVTLAGIDRMQNGEIYSLKIYNQYW